MTETDVPLRALSRAFADPELEHRYRTATLDAHRLRGAPVLGVVLLMAVLLLLRDLTAAGAETAEGLPIRAIGIVASSLVLIALLRAKTPQQMDMASLAASGVLIGSTAAIYLVQPHLHPSHFAIDTLFMFLIATAFPSRLSHQAGPVLVMIGVTIAANIVRADTVAEAATSAVTLATVGSVALLLARHVNTSERSLFWARESVRTLRGIVPICAECKNIRDEAGEWHSVADYVTRGTEARFTHGLCGICEAKALAEIP